MIKINRASCNCDMVMIMAVVLFVVDFDLAFCDMSVCYGCLGVSQSPWRQHSRCCLQKGLAIFIAPFALPSAPGSTDRCILHNGVASRETRPRALLLVRKGLSLACPGGQARTGLTLGFFFGAFPCPCPPLPLVI